jgi:hypothetical protein
MNYALGSFCIRKSLRNDYFIAPLGEESSQIFITINTTIPYCFKVTTYFVILEVCRMMLHQWGFSASELGDCGFRLF